MLAQLSSSEELVEFIKAEIAKAFPSHPFEKKFDRASLLRMLRDYIALSEAFPYVMASAYSGHVIDSIKKRKPIDNAAAITAAVGSFLCWDEMGGHALSLSEGNKGLANIIEPNKRSHSSLLLADMARITDEEIRPDYSSATIQYLETLREGLGSQDPVVRCAYMVAFEFHAERIISAVWTAISNTFDVEPNELLYFRIHVGGDDPAEKYHMEMTARMIDKLVPSTEIARFNELVTDAYAVSVGWSRQIADPKDGCWIDGGCHCGALKFRALIKSHATVYRCNCSICRMSGFLHLPVPESEFELMSDGSTVTEYQFNTKTARHTFCSVCGIKPFYRPRSNPSGYTVNMNCLSSEMLLGSCIKDFDGANWEACIGQHPDLSKPIK